MKYFIHRIYYKVYTKNTLLHILRFYRRVVRFTVGSRLLFFYKLSHAYNVRSFVQLYTLQNLNTKLKSSLEDLVASFFVKLF